jgi:hypothetical protein
MTNYKEVLAIDPGTHCGFARFIDGIQVEVGVVHHEEEIWPWLGKQRPNCWVVEDYKIRSAKHGGFDHEFQSVFPAQVIGAIKFFAYNLGVPVFLQQPSIKNAAAPLVHGKPYKKQANRHYYDAFLHGAYFLKTHK